MKVAIKIKFPQLINPKYVNLQHVDKFPYCDGWTRGPRYVSFEDALMYLRECSARSLARVTLEFEDGTQIPCLMVL